MIIPGLWQLGSQNDSYNALDELLETSRENNGRLSITGMLLYKDGNFM